MNPDQQPTVKYIIFKFLSKPLSFKILGFLPVIIIILFAGWSAQHFGLLEGLLVKDTFDYWHGINMQWNCPQSIQGGQALGCGIKVSNNIDTAHDTIEITSAVFVVKSAGGDISSGNLLPTITLKLNGGASCNEDQTLCTLPYGSSIYFYAAPYTPQPSDPNPLHATLTVSARDTCSSGVSGCNPAPGSASENIGTVTTVLWADLIPQYLDLSVQGTVMVGNSVNFSGYVKNQGTGNAILSNARFELVNNDSGVDSYFNPISVPALDPDSPKYYVDTVSSPWTATLEQHYTIWLCANYNHAALESVYANNCISKNFDVVGPPEQWLKTEKGDVGVKGAINMSFHPDGQDNAEYLVLAEKTINYISGNPAFTSTKKWLVQNYPSITNPSLSIYPSAASSFASLSSLYSKKVTVTISTVGDEETAWFNIWQALLAGGIGKYKGNVLINNYEGGFVWTGGPAVIFIDGDLTINNSVYMKDDTTGLIFVVSGKITVTSSATNPIPNLEGVFISYGKFNTSSYSDKCLTDPTALPSFRNALTIKGAVYSLSKDPNTTCFTRNIGKAADINQTPPAERIIYDPKYLVLFRGLLGNIVTNEQEISP